MATVTTRFFAQEHIDFYAELNFDILLPIQRVKVLSIPVISFHKRGSVSPYHDELQTVIDI
jgi:hypothetical protein